jgi:heptosyltransferase-2
MAKYKDFKNIIVRMPNHVGDCVMATPVLSDLKQHFTSAKITVMCKQNIVSMFEKDQDVDFIIGFTKPKNRRERKKIAMQLRERNFDLGVLLPNSFSSAFLFWQAGIGARLGYSRDGRRLLLTHPVKQLPSWQSYHFVDQYKMILKGVGVKRSRTKPRLFLDEKDLKRARTILNEAGVSEVDTIIGVNPSAASGTAKIWPKEKFRQLVQALSTKPNVKILLFGDNFSKPTVDEITQGQNAQVINLAAKTTLQEAIAIIKLCKVMVSNDSGPMHIAAAVNTPVVAIFGPTNDLLSGPYTHFCHIIHKHVKCSPCHLGTCPIDHRCMLQIQVEEVLDKVVRWLNVSHETLLSYANQR